MITTELQRQATLGWIQYWKQSVASGEQSWLANEDARAEIMQLHAEIKAYDNLKGPNETG